MKKTISAMLLLLAVVITAQAQTQQGQEEPESVMYRSGNSYVIFTENSITFHNGELTWTGTYTISYDTIIPHFNIQTSNYRIIDNNTLKNYRDFIYTRTTQEQFVWWDQRLEQVIAEVRDYVMNLVSTGRADADTVLKAIDSGSSWGEILKMIDSNHPAAAIELMPVIRNPRGKIRG